MEKPAPAGRMGLGAGPEMMSAAEQKRSRVRGAIVVSFVLITICAAALVVFEATSGHKIKGASSDVVQAQLTMRACISSAYNVNNPYGAKQAHLTALRKCRVEIDQFIDKFCPKKSDICASDADDVIDKTAEAAKERALRIRQGGAE